MDIVLPISWSILLYAGSPVVVDGQVFFGSGLPGSDAFDLVGATDGSTFYALGLP
jgi:hypothetical protein